MIIRLKPFVAIQEIKDEISISGLYKNDIIIERNDDNLLLLSRLKFTNGIEVDIAQKNPIIEKLYECGCVEVVEPNCISDAQRNLLFYDYINFDFERIKNKNILVFGAGAAGGTITYLLAQQGFTSISCVDNDVVEYSDVNKTMVYDVPSIGKLKVEAIKQRIAKNFGVQIRAIPSYLTNINDVATIFDHVNPSLIVYAIDPQPSFKLNLDKYCLSKRIPIIHASYSYEKILCGPCVIPFQTACMVGYNEYWKQRTLGSFDYNYVRKLFTETTVHPSISFNINLLSSIIVKDTIFCLGEQYEKVSTLNCLITIDLLNSEINENYLSCQFCKDCVAKTSV